jgi:hypothetical protein
MSLLAALVIAAASARVESVSLTTADARLAVRVALSGTPGMVTVHREGDVARVSIMDAELGLRFAGGRRFAWTPSDGFDPGLLASTPARLDRLELVASPSEVSLLLQVPPDASIEARRDVRGLLIVFRRALAPPSEAEVVMPPPVAAAPTEAEPAAVPAAAPTEAPASPPPLPAPEPQPQVALAPPEATQPEATPPAAAPSAVAAPEPAPLAVAAGSEPAPAPSAVPDTVAPAAASSQTAAGDDTVARARALFPVAAETTAAGTESVTELYARLFPSGAPAREAEVAPSEDLGVRGDSDLSGYPVGPFRVRLSVDARYVDADTFIESDAEPTRDQYLEVGPRLSAQAAVGAGSLTLEYTPALRAFATYDQVNSNSHIASAALEVPVGANVTLRARDRFAAGTLDTRIVDPGGEYFYGLGRFYRNDVDAGASILVGPRLSVELGGGAGRVRFQEPSSFFSFDTRQASAGLGFEVTPSLKAVGSYVYDAVPRPVDRPEAEASAHSGRLTLTGDVLPLLTGELSVGYRSQSNPNAGPGGRSFSGFVMSGALTRQLAPDSSFTLYLSRATPPSAYEENGFYVATSVQGSLQVPLPLALELRTGAGYQWNDYRTVSPELGLAREDGILGWFVALRRPIRRGLFLSGMYRADNRDSNADQFDTDTDGFVLQLEWDALGSPSR